MTVPYRTISRAAAGAAATASALAYPFLPDRVATHFDVDGRPDRFGSRARAAITLPAVMAGLTVLDGRLGAWPGGGDREDGNSGARVRAEAIGLAELAMLPGHLAVLASGMGWRIDMSRFNRGVTGLVLVALGNLMPKLPRNGLAGIRTPWTLADPAVWERTHRLGGYLVTAAGLAHLLSLPWAGKRSARLPLAALLAAVGLSAGYSFVDYERRRRTGR